MKYQKKILVLFLILTILIFSLSGCSYLSQGINSYAYVVSMGFDVSDNNNLRITFQIAIPPSSSSSGSSEGGGSSQSSDVIVNTVDCATIDSGINIVNSYVSKQINLSHCKVIVFSEELAKLGISDYIYTLVNNIQIRPNTNIIVSRCDAKSYLTNSKPILETLSARYYETAPTASKYTGFTDNINIDEFFESLISSTSEPYAILGSIISTSQDTSANKSDGEYLAGQTPIETEEKSIENMGLAVFSGDQFIGELNGLETICHLILTNNLDTCSITIPDPQNSEKSIDLSIRLDKKTKIKIDTSSGSPHISLEVKLKARIPSMSEEANYQNKSYLNKIGEYANSYFETQILEYLYKTSKEFKTDIVGFGKYAAMNFLTLGDFENYNWLLNYKNAFFNVNVDTNVKSSYLILKGSY